MEPRNGAKSPLPFRAAILFVFLLLAGILFYLGPSAILGTGIESTTILYAAEDSTPDPPPPPPPGGP